MMRVMSWKEKELPRGIEVFRRWMLQFSWENFWQLPNKEALKDVTVCLPFRTEGMCMLKTEGAISNAVAFL